MKKERPITLVIAEELQELYDFRYNTIKETSEYSEKGAENYQEVSEKFINTLVVNFKCADIKCTYTTIDQILNSDIIDQYNPFEEYFNSLPKWDESNQSEITRLIQTVETTKQEFFSICLKRWLLALVNCTLNSSIINHQMIVFSGKQGIGKSTWIRNLVPDELLDHYYSGAINLNNKDTSIFLSECFLINLDELTNLSKKETGSLKEVITKDSINTRKAYARKSKRLARRASFIGSINDSEFLYDLTGSRRFLCFEVLKIIFDHDIDMSLVYSEAKYLLEKGEQSYFTMDEIQLIEENNEMFRIKSSWEILILDHFSNSETEDSHVFYKIRVNDIYNSFKPMGPARTGDLVTIGRILNKLQYKSCKVNGSKYYLMYASHSVKMRGIYGVDLRNGLNRSIIKGVG